MNKLNQNILKVYLLNFFMMFLMVLPVIVPYWQSKGLSLSDIYILQAVYGVVIILLDLPMGYISDLFGRKACLVGVGIFNGISLTILAKAQTFWGFVGFEVLSAIAVSLYSGCDIALVYDSLAALGDQGKSGSVLGKRFYYSQIGESIAAVAGGLLAAHSLHLPFALNGFFGWIPLLIALTLQEPPRKKFSSKNHLDNFQEIYSAIFKQSHLLRKAILFFMIYGFATHVAIWSFQAYWKNIGVTTSHFGYWWAAINLTGALVGRSAPRIEKKIGTGAVIILVGILPIIGYLGMSLIHFYIGVVIALLFPICRGLNYVVMQDAINSRVQPEVRATVNSVSSLGVRALAAIAGPVAGMSFDRFGFPITFSGLSLILIITFFVIVVPMLKHKHELAQQH
jgi:MFS family permease